MKNKLFGDRKALEAYHDYERRIYVRHLEVGSYLVIVLMPAGVLLDYFVYPRQVAFFFALRLAAAFLGDDSMVWEVLGKALDDELFRGFVGFGDQVVRAFQLEGDTPFEVIAQQRSGFVRNLCGGFSEGRHWLGDAFSLAGTRRGTPAATEPARDAPLQKLQRPDGHAARVR